MSRTHAIHDATGVLATDQEGNILVLHHNGSNDPATDLDSSAGYAVGCLAINANGTDKDTVLYSNIGSVTSANFNAISTAAD